MTQLSEHFSLEELTATAHRGIDNTAPPPVVEHLKTLAMALEGVRTLLGGPLHINSGYRCPDLNKAVGGARNSAHMSGFAADFICPSFGDPLAICHAVVASPIHFDQIIQEGTWCHLSFAPAMRRSILTKAAGGGYRDGL